MPRSAQATGGQDSHHTQPASCILRQADAERVSGDFAPRERRPAVGRRGPARDVQSLAKADEMASERSGQSTADRLCVLQARQFHRHSSTLLQNAPGLGSMLKFCSITMQQGLLQLRCVCVCVCVCVCLGERLTERKTDDQANGHLVRTYNQLIHNHPQ